MRSESWVSWEVKSIKVFISKMVMVGVKCIRTQVWKSQVPFKKKIYRPRIAEIGGVGGEIYYCGSQVCYTQLSM